MQEVGDEKILLPDRKANRTVNNTRLTKPMPFLPLDNAYFVL